MFPEHVERSFLDPEYSFDEYFQLGSRREVVKRVPLGVSGKAAGGCYVKLASEGVRAKRNKNTTQRNKTKQNKTNEVSTHCIRAINLPPRRIGGHAAVAGAIMPTTWFIEWPRPFFKPGLHVPRKGESLPPVHMSLTTVLALKMKCYFVAFLFCSHSLCVGVIEGRAPR